MRRILSIAVIAVGGTIGLMAMASSAGAGSRPDVDAVLECIILNGDSDGYVAVFGYQNNETSTIDLPIGNDNNFTPNPSDRGQPTTFSPGRHRNVVKVESPGSALTWHVPGSNATANKNSEQCAAPPVPTGNDSPQAVVLIAAAAGVIVVGGGASSWWISRRKRRAT
jgi:hypothetical protein